MDAISRDIAAYEKMQDELEMDHFGEWVVFYDEELVDTYPTYTDAIWDAAQKYERGPYLVRQIGAAPVVSLPYISIVPDDTIPDDAPPFRSVYDGNLDGVPEGWGTR